MICNTKGYVYKLEIYLGQENEERFRKSNEPDLGACSHIVIRLTRDVPKFHYHRIYFDNYYTTLPLLAFLKREREGFSPLVPFGRTVLVNVFYFHERTSRSKD